MRWPGKTSGQQGSWKPPPEFDRANVVQYLKLVKRALAPKGKFIVTIPLRMADAATQLLLEQNFRILLSREVTGKEIQVYGSPDAKSKYERGLRPFRIIAESKKA